MTIAIHDGASAVVAKTQQCRHRVTACECVSMSTYKSYFSLIIIDEIWSEEMNLHKVIQ